MLKVHLQVLQGRNIGASRRHQPKTEPQTIAKDIRHTRRTRGAMPKATWTGRATAPTSGTPTPLRLRHGQHRQIAIAGETRQIILLNKVVHPAATWPCEVR